MKISFDHTGERKYVIVDTYNITEILLCLEKQMAYDKKITWIGKPIKRRK